MPFIKRTVEPQYLSNRPLPASCERELDTVSNNTLCGLVRQLGDLSLRANDIFSDINAEAHLLAHRAIHLRRRLIKLEDVVEKLDARSVRVPVSSLEQFKNTTGHYKAQQDVDKDLFVQGTRPGCLQVVYNQASTDLKDIYAKFKEYHEDEVTVISMQASSLLAAEIKAQSEYNIIFPRKKENLPNPKRTQRPLSDADILMESYLQRVQSPLPTPEEALRKHVGPSSLVTIDTSGTGFERMANIRRSLTLTFRMSSRGRKERRDRKAWRRTVTGIPREVEEELHLRQGGRPRSNSGSEYTSSSSTDFEEIRTQSLDRKLKYSVREYNRAYEARKAAAAAAVKDGKPSIAVVAPLRNRRRHRHSMADSGKLEKALNLNGSASLPRGVGLLRPRSVPPGGAMGTVQFSDSSADSSMERIWQTSAANRLNEKAESSKHHNLYNSQGKPKIFLPQMSHLPNAVISTQACVIPIPTSTAVTSRMDPQQHQHHPHPHQQQQHLPQQPDQAELAASVRLRMQKSGVRKEDRRSSSGNWSGTDSTRTSVCSEQDSQGNSQVAMDASPSDSAVSLSNEVECTQTTPVAPCAGSSFPGVINGDGSRPCFLPVQKSSQGSSSGSPTPTNELEAGGTFTRLDTETWLKSVGASSTSAQTAMQSKPELGNTAPSIKGPLKPQLSFGDSSSESSVENNASIVSDNTSLDLDAYFGDSAEEFQDTDSLSAFSVDQEGYWTSMHSDCGLSPKHSKYPTIPEHPQSVGYDYDIAAHYKGKDSKGGFITPRNKAPKDSAGQQAPTLPKRDDSFSLDSQLANLHLQGGSPASLDSSSPSNQTLTNDSDGSRSVTPAPSDMSDVSSASYDLPPPLGSPTEPKMYTLCFGGANRGPGLPGSTPGPGRQVSSGAHTLPSTLPSGGLHYTQPLTSSSGRISDAPSAQTTLSMSRQNHFPASSTAAAPSSSKSAADFWATPIIPGAMLKARERFYGFKPSKLDTSAGQTIPESDGDVTPVTSPRTPTDSNMFFAMYPGSYSVIKKKSKDSTYTIYSNGMSASLINKPADVISPTNSLDRKQKFNRYVSDLQAQAPQAYDALNQLKMGEERTKAMSREQRAEILEQMRKSKSSGRNGSLATPPTTPTSPPIIPLTTDVSSMLAASAARDSPIPTEEGRTTSFRTSYKEGIGSKNLDPDKAIIHAARRLEDQCTTSDGKEQDEVQTDDTLESDETDARPTTPKNVQVDGNEDIPEEYTPYVFDPKRLPGSSILKGSPMTADTKLKVRKSKKLSISTDPFAETTIGQMMAADSPYDNVPSNTRTIRFSETVIVENTPVRVCLVSGKPRTNMSDFKALLQQSSPSSGKPVSACSALNVKSSVKGPRNAELLYRGILQEEDEDRRKEERNSTESPVQGRKLVTVNDLKNAMASARGNVQMVDIEEAKEKHEIVNKSSCATITAIPEVASLPIRETVINGADEHSETDKQHPDKTESKDVSEVKSTDVCSPDINGCDSAPHIDEAPCTAASVSCNTSNNNSNNKGACPADPTPDIQAESLSSGAKSPDVQEQPPQQQQGDDASGARRVPKHSWSDTDLNRSDLMAAIRDRGKRPDQRVEAVAQLEEANTRSPSRRRPLPVSRSEGSIHSILNSVKHSIQKMSPKHEPHDGSDMDYPPDAWD